MDHVGLHASAVAVLGSAHLAPHVRSPRLQSRGAPADANLAGVVLLLRWDPLQGALGPSSPPSGRGPIGVHGRTLITSDVYIVKPMPASPRGVAHGRGPRLALGLHGAWG